MLLLVSLGPINRRSLTTMLKTQLSSFLSIAVGVCAVALLGCGEKPKPVATEFVEGIVTLDGKPVEDATVTFAPVSEGAGASASGRTDPAGKYTLTAVGAGKGAQAGGGTLPGEYYVGVQKDQYPDIPGSDQPDYEPPKSEGRPQAPTLTHIVPQKFNDPRKSGIKVTVKAGKNDIPIELKSSD
ncbi:MAG TPA: Ig-like domain-containing protein [Pirellulales bacterium]